MFDAKRLTDRKFPVVQADMKRRPFKVLSGSGDKTMIQVQSHERGEEVPHRGDILHGRRGDEGGYRSVS